jgi:small subunit ribosomal protein S8
MGVITDPIADMLTRIRNANAERHDSVRMPSSKVKEEIARILLAERFIAGYEVKTDGKFPELEIQLRYGSRREKILNGIKRISTPGLRQYCSAKQIPRVLNGLGIAIITTSKGVMTDRDARRLRLGGEVLAHVW